jgi:hypothetical protein
MSFLGCLISPWTSPTLSFLYAFEGPLLMVTIGLKFQTVDRLAFPHVSLGQAQLGLATKPRVLYICSFPWRSPPIARLGKAGLSKVGSLLCWLG